MSFPLAPWRTRLSDGRRGGKESVLHSNSQTFLRNKKERRFVLGATQHSAKSAASGSRRRIEPPTRGRTSPTLRRAWPKDGPLAAICVQSVDVPCVLQFTLIHAAGCVLHRRTSRVIHRLKLFSLSFCNFFGSPTSTISARQRSRANGSPMFHRSVYHEEKKGKKKTHAGRPALGSLSLRHGGRWTTWRLCRRLPLSDLPAAPEPELDIPTGQVPQFHTFSGWRAGQSLGAPPRSLAVDCLLSPTGRRCFGEA